MNFATRADVLKKWKYTDPDVMWSINESLIVLVAAACSDPHTSLFWLSRGSSLNNIQSTYFGCLPESSLLLISGLYLTKPWRFTLQTLSLVRHCMLVQKLRQSYHILVLDIFDSWYCIYWIICICILANTLKNMNL